MQSLRRALVAALALASVLVPNLALAAPDARVINGRPTFDDEPGVAAIVALGFGHAKSAWEGQFCGGTLVAPRVVVTARHCVDDAPFITDARSIVVYRGANGSLDLPKSGWGGVTTSGVVSIHRSPGDFTRTFLTGGDITVLRLARELPGTTPISYVRPADSRWYGARSTGVTLMGWGFTIDANPFAGQEKSGKPTRLQTADMPIVPTATCQRKAAVPSVAKHYLCAGTLGDLQTAQSACNGDSGGPLIASDPAGDFTSDATERRLVGVASHTNADMCSGSYVRFTSVAKFASWIDGFVATSDNAPSGTTPPVIRSVKRSGAQAVKIVAANPGGGPAPKRQLVTVSLGLGQLLQAGTIGPKGGIALVPPTKQGKISVLLRSIDAAGNESGASAPKVVSTVRDVRKPRIGRVSARHSKGAWTFNWGRPSDNDRVVAVRIEVQSRGRWLTLGTEYCVKCWTGTTRIRSSIRVGGPPGHWTFRFTPVDRAFNIGPGTVVRT